MSEVIESRRLHAVDLFCGIGGLTYGLSQAGIRVIAGFDSDNSCRYAYEANNLGAEFIGADIRDVGEREIAPYFEGADVRVLVGCAPCQPFSSHTVKVKSKRKDSNWNLIQEFLRIILELKPEIVSMENVPRLMSKSIYKGFKYELENAGYEISDDVVNSAHYGVPQSRRRLVMFGSLMGEKIEFPERNYFEPNTVKNIIGSLEPLEHGQSSKRDPLHICSRLESVNLERIQASIPGESWRCWPTNLLPDCYKKESGASYGSVYGRMEWNKVSPTITTQFFRYGTGRFGHPEQDRALSLREGALLQTFPPNYRFSPTDEDITLNRIGRHIGNAVPPSLAFVIGNAITSHLDQ